jgi:hypothetical protein
MSVQHPPLSFDRICHRAGGRRHYNAVRQFRALARRLKVLELADRFGLFLRGAQARIARELGVHRSTVCRDLKVLLREYRAWVDEGGPFRKRRG